MLNSADILDRLNRRGKVTIAAEDGSYDVRLKAHGPWLGGCTTDKHDLYEHCRFGAKDWHGDGSDLATLLVQCDMETRPDSHDIDDIVWLVKRRRATRTCGPPLPTYRRWGGWSPGLDRWLRTFDHQHEYLAGYLRDIDIEQQFEAEREVDRKRRERAQRDHVRRVLEDT